MLKEPDQPVPRDVVEEAADISVNYPSDLAPFHPDRERVKSIVCPAPRPEPIAEPQEFRLVDRRENHLRHCLLDDFVLNGRDAERSCPTVRLGYVDPPRWNRPVRSRVHALVQVGQPAFQPLPVHTPRHAIGPGCRTPLQLEERPAQSFDRDVVQKRGETLPWFPLYVLPYPVSRLCHAFPVLRPARALTFQIPLGLGPSLHRLRRNGCSFVRRLHSYYSRV